MPEEVASDIRAIIRQNLTARHVPAKILRVTDIPYTRSGKKVCQRQRGGDWPRVTPLGPKPFWRRSLSREPGESSRELSSGDVV